MSWLLCVVFYNWLFLAMNFRTLKRPRETSSQMQPGAVLVGSPFLMQNSLSNLGLRYWGSRVESELIGLTFCMLYCPIAILAPAWIFLHGLETSYRLRTTMCLSYPVPLCRGALSKHWASWTNPQVHSILPTPHACVYVVLSARAFRTSVSLLWSLSVH